MLTHSTTWASAVVLLAVLGVVGALGWHGTLGADAVTGVVTGILSGVGGVAVVTHGVNLGARTSGAPEAKAPAADKAA